MSQIDGGTGHRLFKTVNLPDVIKDLAKKITTGKTLCSRIKRDGGERRG